MADPVIKVEKDGSVTKDGDVIGRVEKRQAGPGPLETELGFTLTGGKPQWFGFAADGTQLSTYGDDTRKKAVRRIEKHAEPLTVTDMKVETGLTTSGLDCITAWVHWQGYGASVSRYPHESAWIVDCIFTPGSMMPMWSNGTGTRYTQARSLQAAQEAAATAEALRLGLLVPDGDGYVWPAASTAPADLL